MEKNWKGKKKRMMKKKSLRTWRHDAHRYFYTQFDTFFVFSAF